MKWNIFKTYDKVRSLSSFRFNDQKTAFGRSRISGYGFSEFKVLRGDIVERVAWLTTNRQHRITGRLHSELSSAQPLLQYTPSMGFVEMSDSKK